MDWIQIGSAVFLGAMLIYLFPRAKQVMENTPKGSKSDWMGYIMPMALVGLFILLLISLV